MTYLNFYVSNILLMLTLFGHSPKVQDVAFPFGYIHLESCAPLGAVELEVFIVPTLNSLESREQFR